VQSLLLRNINLLVKVSLRRHCNIVKGDFFISFIIKKHRKKKAPINKANHCGKRKKEKEK
jgi:hypothetical protein